MLNPWGLLDTEREAGALLFSCIGSLEVQVHKFETAVRLADYCDKERAPLHDLAASGDWRAGARDSQFIHWKQLAADAGAIAVYNFAELIQAIEGLIGQCPTAKEHLDRQSAGEGRSLFNKNFPGFADIRFAVAHAGKPFASPQVNQKQRLPGSEGIITNRLTDRTLYSTVNGREAHYTLAMNSAEALGRAAELIQSAFVPVREFTSQFNSARPRERD